MERRWLWVKVSIGSIIITHLIRHNDVHQYGNSMMFAISSFRMLSFVLNITFEWEAAMSWPSVAKIFFRKLTTCVWEKGKDGAGHYSESRTVTWDVLTFRPGQRCKPCSLHILFSIVAQVFRLVAAVSIDWWKYDVICWGFMRCQQCASHRHMRSIRHKSQIRLTLCIPQGLFASDEASHVGSSSTWRVASE